MTQPPKSPFSNLPKSHDHLLRYALSHKETVKEFFGYALPSFVKKDLDFESLVPQKETFVDTDLQSMEADLLYQAT